MKKVLLLGGTGLVGRAIERNLRGVYQVVVTAGHHESDGDGSWQWRKPGACCQFWTRKIPIS